MKKYKVIGNDTNNVLHYFDRGTIVERTGAHVTKSGSYEVCDGDGFSQLVQPADLEEIKEPSFEEIKEGDLFKVTKPYHLHCFKAGDTVRVTGKQTEYDKQWIAAEYLDKDTAGNHFLTLDEVTFISPEAVPAPEPSTDIEPAGVLVNTPDSTTEAMMRYELTKEAMKSLLTSKRSAGWSAETLGKSAVNIADSIINNLYKKAS